MITIVYSTNKDSEYNQNFYDHLSNTVGIPNVQILEFINHNEFSLSQIYNKGIEQSKYNIVVCVHNDIKLEKNWGQKLLNDFEQNPEFSIIGKAGSCVFPKSGIYWESMSLHMVGQVYHHPDGSKKWVNNYSAKIPYLIPVITIDGLFIAFDKTRIKHRFDESIGRFHFYDHLFCLPNYLDDIKIGVTSSFEITHKSVGRPNNEFFETKEKFLEKYGNNLPLELKPDRIYVPQIKVNNLKNVGKTAVIILTKSNLNLLFQALSSITEKSSGVDYDIYIADTGSIDEEKNQIKSFIEKYSNMTLLEFDYYNFAKINNEVVKNHLKEKYEYLIFCNNDIKLLNNVIYGMVETMKYENNVGTIGCRLHFADNTIQHDGILAMIDRNNKFQISHLGFKSFYNYSNGKKNTIGNTGGLMMIKKSIFEKCGFFNENYESCLEDAELNMKCIILGLQNITRSDLVAYHYESQTRKDDVNGIEKFQKDYLLLHKFTEINFAKLKNKFVYLNG